MLQLKGMSAQWGQTIHDNSNVIYNLGIRNGLAGFALFFYYRSEKFKRKEDEEAFYEFFEECIDRFNRGYRHEAWLFDLTDLIYLIHETRPRLAKVYDVHELLIQLAGSLESGVKELLENQIFDPFIGAFYPAFCFMSEYPDHSLLKVLRDALIDHSQIDSDGLHYFNSCFAGEKIYLSIGHGLSAYIAFLSNYLEIYPDDDKVKHLLENFLKFIMKQRKEADFPCFFGDFVGDKNVSSLSLCYGDCGILYALLKGAKITQNCSIYEEATLMAIATGRRSLDRMEVQNDVSLLYGASGMYLYFDLIGEICNNDFLTKVGAKWKIRTYSLLSQNIEAMIAMDKSRLFKLMSFQEGVTGAFGSLLSDNKALFLKIHHLN
ncbi:lanthionine synthetase LanC family protein [Pedobacter sp. CFBP9032]|uniref:lanthionine synthetase LanC family protein n=1 Tax=Pedobacter sp. CFBP9032 TaxID=3096539 RepID=UPI002A6A7B13|nr:lanthionine synthetase LanC family protein [Pedobacter sp. CFBP9032]